ncbi:MAG TPA: hypothetical protein VKQ34_02180 [Candidatus Saccharimonadales bacterium]|nr:hypothetical protein [Candidatus Saccharimonadales bacterium]
MYTYVASDTRRDVRRLPTELGGFRDLKESTDGLTPAMRGLQGAGDRVDTAEIEALAGTLWDADARGYDLEEHEQRQRHGAVLVIPGFQLVEAKPPRVQYLGAQ